MPSESCTAVLQGFPCGMLKVGQLLSSATQAGVQVRAYARRWIPLEPNGLD